MLRCSASTTTSANRSRWMCCWTRSSEFSASQPPPPRENPKAQAARGRFSVDPVTELSTKSTLTTVRSNLQSRMVRRRNERQGPRTSPRIAIRSCSMFSKKNASTGHAAVLSESRSSPLPTDADSRCRTRSRSFELTSFPGRGADRVQRAQGSSIRRQISSGRKVTRHSQF